MKPTLQLTAFTALLAVLSSCTQMSPSSTETIPKAKVELKENNYRVLASRVSGEDSGFTLLPCLSIVPMLATIYPNVDASHIPSGIVITSASEAAALDELYEKSGANTPGRATQLINIRKEVGGYNAIIFGRPKVRVTADLIEFTH